MNLSSISLALTRLASSVARAWSPLALWPNGAASPGMWIDPSLLTASFNDYTGTTPVVTPGTVADSSNPVGLALDIRAGAPTTLGPELVTNGDFSAGTADWSVPVNNVGSFAVVSGRLQITRTGASSGAYQAIPFVSGKSYRLSFAFEILTGAIDGVYLTLKLSVDINDGSRLQFTVAAGAASGVCEVVYSASNSETLYLMPVLYAGATLVAFDNVSVREIPGHHMLQATSAARPLESARVNSLTHTEDFSNGVWVIDVAGTGALTKTLGQNDPLGGTSAVRLLAETNGFANTASFRYADGLATEQVIRSLYIKSNTGLGYSCYLGDTPITLIADTAWHRYDVSENAFSWGIRVSFVSVGITDVTIAFPQRELGTNLTPYQSVPTDGSTYSATGITPFQLYDGVDDGMATASFAAGTLINGMDCMIAVRRDSAANCVAGLYNGIADATKFFGMAESGSGSGCVGSGAGTPTVWVDNTQLTGGTAVTRGTLHTALTAGNVHILEFRGLDLSTWTATGFGLYTSYVFPGARGDIMLFESTASTEDKDAARQYLADLYGVTLA